MGRPTLGAFVCLAFVAAGCGLHSDLSTTFADFIPPPRPVVLYGTGQLKEWPDEGAYYASTRAQSFDLHVEHGRFNVLAVMQNGKPLERIDRKSVSSRRQSDGPNVVFFIREALEDDPSKMVVKSRITILPGASAINDGCTSTFQLVERSVSPRFVRTPQELGPPLTVRICYVEGSPEILRFDMVPDSRARDSVTLQWKVNRAKHIEVWQGKTKVYDTVSPLPSQSFSGWQSVSLTGRANGPFKLRAENGIGQAQERFATMAGKPEPALLNERGNDGVEESRVQLASAPAKATPLRREPSPETRIAKLQNGVATKAGQRMLSPAGEPSEVPPLPFSLCFFCPDDGQGGSLTLSARSEADAIQQAKQQVGQSCEVSFGKHEHFRFCLTCSEGLISRSEYALAACTAEQAEQWVLSQKKLCGAREGTCSQ